MQLPAAIAAGAADDGAAGGRLCLVYEACVQKVAEARLPTAVLAQVFGLDPIPLEQVEIELAVHPQPRLTGRPLQDTLISCGVVRAAALVSRHGSEGFIPLGLNLVIQEEEAVPGVRPTDLLVQRVVDFEGAAVCRAPGTGLTLAAARRGLQPSLVTEEFTLFKAAFLVHQQVLRRVQRPRPCAVQVWTPPPPPPAAPWGGEDPGVQAVVEPVSSAGPSPEGGLTSLYLPGQLSWRGKERRARRRGGR